MSSSAVRSRATAQDPHVRDQLEKTLLIGSGRQSATPQDVAYVTQAARNALAQGHQLREGRLTSQQTPWLTLMLYEDSDTPYMADMQLHLIESAYKARHGGARLPEAINRELANRLQDLYTRLDELHVFLVGTRVTVLLNLDDPLKPIPLAEMSTDRGPLSLFAKAGQARPTLKRLETINLTLTAAYASEEGLWHILYHELGNLT